MCESEELAMWRSRWLVLMGKRQEMFVFLLLLLEGKATREWHHGSFIPTYALCVRSLLDTWHHWHDRANEGSSINTNSFYYCVSMFLLVLVVSIDEYCSCLSLLRLIISIGNGAYDSSCSRMKAAHHLPLMWECSDLSPTHQFGLERGAYVR